MRIACPPIEAIILNDIDWGKRLYERGVSRSACRNQDEMAGWDEAAIEVMTLPPLQLLIDYGAELQELQDDMEDRLFWAQGGW
jgi:hypothetical protein